jgi:hypothetical protein
MKMIAYPHKWAITLPLEAAGYEIAYMDILEDREELIVLVYYPKTAREASYDEAVARDLLEKEGFELGSTGPGGESGAYFRIKLPHLIPFGCAICDEWRPEKRPAVTSYGDPLRKSWNPRMCLGYKPIGPSCEGEPAPYACLNHKPCEVKYRDSPPFLGF